MKSLKELDIKALQDLSAKINVIPVIAKADTLTQEEKSAFKKTVRNIIYLIHVLLVIKFR
jgi:septin family protein